MSEPSALHDSLSDTERPIAIIGAGSIGLGFAIVFAQAGYTVRVQDPDPQRRNEAGTVIRARLETLEENALIDEAPVAIAARISFSADLESVLERAFHVQECAPENLALKQDIYARLDALAPPDAVLASSSSAIAASRYTSELVGRGRCLVCHPANPPYLLRILEIVPTPFTSPEVTDRTQAFMTSCGFAPVVVQKEIEGFALNRLQGAVLREAYCLVRDGILSVDEVDSLVRDGLGLRWSFMGPFETTDLNTRGGIRSHAQKMGASYARMGAERGQHDPWTPDLVAKVEAERRALVPLDQWESANAWRDARLMALLRHQREMKRLDDKYGRT